MKYRDITFTFPPMLSIKQLTSKLFPLLFCLFRNNSYLCKIENNLIANKITEYCNHEL